MAGGCRTRSTRGADASASELGAEPGDGVVHGDEKATIKEVLESVALSQYYNEIVTRFSTLARCRRLKHQDLRSVGVPSSFETDMIIQAFKELGLEADDEREARQLIERGLTPAGMRVLRSLWLDQASCSALTALPEGLVVGDTLSLTGCSALTSLPRSLGVGGHLELNGCSALQERHRDDMGAFFAQLSTVLGPKAGLSLDGWKAVEHVPDGFSVGGNLSLSGCSALTSLGDGLSVGGDLYLCGCYHLTDLGDDLSVGGHLDLEGCLALISLPDGLSVGGLLTLTGCLALQKRHRGDMGMFFKQLSAALGPKAGLSLWRWDAVEQVPDGLSVGGDLNLSGCSALTSLGDGLNVGGNLDLRWCSALTSLGDGVSVGGDLDGSCSALSSLGEGLCVGGDLNLNRCSALGSLGEGLRVGGLLNLGGCSVLSSLPGRLSVGGILFLGGCFALQERHCSDMGTFFAQVSAALGPKAGLCLNWWNAIEQVPDDLSVGGDLDLSGCSALTSLGDGLNVGGNLDLRWCSALTSLGDGLSVGGDLDGNCSALSSLGEGLCVGGLLNLGGCLALQERHRGDVGAFFEQLSVVLGPKAGLSLAGWDALKRVPDGFRVGGDLNFKGCSALTSLGDGLNVGGHLHLEGCSALTSLGDGLSVGGDPNLGSCCSVLSSLPGSLSVRGLLNLEDCLALQERHRGDMAAFFEQVSAALGPKAGLSLAGWDAVKRVPDGFCVGGDLRFEGCSALTSLGDGLSVDGDLWLNDCLALTSLGDGLSVGGRLDLLNCSALTSLGDGLSVGQYLDLGGCWALQERHRGDMGTFFEQVSAALGPKAGLSLNGWDAVRQVPDGLSVGGCLHFDNCSALTTLGDGLSVGGELVLFNCSALTSLGDGLSVVGGLQFAECPALTSLGDRLSVGGDLDLGSCLALTSLGDGLSVGGDLNPSFCSALTSLGDGLSVGGTLNLEGCRELTSLPASLIKVNGILNLKGCAELTSVPDGLYVDGDLNLAGCGALTSLPTSLRVNNTLDLDECTALEAQHQADMETFLVALREIIGPSGGLRLGGWTTIRELPDCYADIGGQLNLSGCTALTRLPEGLHVRGSLGLEGCTGLRRLPGGLRVDRWLDLTGCMSLTSLPAGLWVSGSLDARQCRSLTSLPEDLYVGGELNLEQCTSLESLPASILEWPMNERGNPHHISLGGSGLSAETLEWLREADAPGLIFHVSLGGIESDDEFGARPGFASAAEAMAFWSSEAQMEAAAVPPTADNATLVRFLSRLRDAKEFGILETRKALAKRVVDVLELLSGDDEDVREELLLRMSDSLDACDDKPVWALNQMHLVVEVAKARESAEQLRDLGRGVMRLMVVHEHAKRKVDSLRWVDDVCVYLRFEIDLREALDLPVAATAMIFPSYIDVTDDDLEAAKDDALAITDAQFEAWLAEWPEWQRHQRHQVVAELTWQALAEIKRRQSLRKRVSRRLSRLVNVVGDKVVDPVTLDGGKSVWSLRDLLKHWERTGLDLHNAPVSVEQLRSDLKRVVA